ncbi:MAG: tRNA-uridine aminocarboxypropyltransferase [Pirellulaceae bacterium]
MDEAPVSERCYQCFRPMSLCFCEAIPRIDNRTDVLILQHIRERFHPFNSARIVKRALGKCQLIADYTQRLRTQRLPIGPSSVLLYPDKNAPLLTELPVGELPQQLVIIDGTWHHAKTIFRDLPQLWQLPCFRLRPTRPGQYRIRREPSAHSLSTLEATVGALRALEPDTAGLDQLMSAFHKMVNGQLEHPEFGSAWRRKETGQSRPRNLPRSLMQNAESLVVAYGEATPGKPGENHRTSTPVSWVAYRLGTTERFSCLLRQQQPLSDAALAHMRLSLADFEFAVADDEFHQRWNEFLRPNDVLIVYHRRTFQLLRHIKAVQPRCLVLKSIFGKWRAGFRSIEELIAIESASLVNSKPNCENNSRASQRLDMAVALVEHLRTMYGKLQ